jgi:subtilisin family serine protease/subtilisin-like proprotein convertase family protein
MALHFWQGGRKVEVEEDEREVTIHASSADSARAAALGANVDLRDPELAAPGLVRAKLPSDRDGAMEQLRKDRVVHHLYRDAKTRQTEYLITDSFYIKFKSGTPRQRIADYLQAERLELLDDLGDLLLLVRVTNETKSNPLRAANRAHGMSDVEYAEPNLVQRVQRAAPFIPADPLFGEQWHLHAPSSTTNLLAGAGIFAPDAWALTLGTREIVVAVADDGFDLTHPDFAHPGKIVGSWNLTPQDSDFVIDGNVSPRPGNYHGTPCAGVAIGESDGNGVVGVAPGCSFLAVRFPLAMSDHHFLLMFERVSRVADVISCSWGYGPGDFPMSTAFKQRITTLATTGGRRGRGLVICVAAGNNNCPVQDLDNTKTYRYLDATGALQSYSGPVDRWLAAHPRVITVSACTSLRKRAAYSSWGRQISVCAPSDNWDDLSQVATRGLGIVTTDNEGAGRGSDFTAGSRFTSDFGGTSSATPTVAGVVALVLSRNPSLSAAEVKTLLERTADKTGFDFVSETAVNEAGEFEDGFSLWFGHGKVNAHEAVLAALPAESSRTVRGSNTVPLAIPDRDAAVSNIIEFMESGSIVDLRVTIDIRHTYIGDLQVELVSPAGRSVTLHNHDGGSSDDLRKTYSTASLPALKAFLGTPLTGKWQLRVTDSWALDTGTLDAWRLDAKISGAPAPSTSVKPKRQSESTRRSDELAPPGE